MEIWGFPGQWKYEIWVTSTIIVECCLRILLGMHPSDKAVRSNKGTPLCMAHLARMSFACASIGGRGASGNAPARCSPVSPGVHASARTRRARAHTHARILPPPRMHAPLLSTPCRHAGGSLPPPPPQRLHSRCCAAAGTCAPRITQGA